MTDQSREQLSAAYGRLILQMSFVWAATLLAAAVVDKAQRRLHLLTSRAHRRLRLV